jgi:hypothetical protein
VSVLRARLLVATSLVLPVAASRAHAGDGESALSPSLGWATYSTLDKMGQSVSPTIGGAAGATYERGVSEALSWRVSAVGGAFAGGGTTWAAWGAAGLVYRFDVLEYVPYVEVSGGAILLGGGPLPSRRPPAARARRRRRLAALARSLVGDRGAARIVRERHDGAHRRRAHDVALGLLLDPG